MKAIILSAGKGSRLLPLTEHKPKCLLPLEGGYTLLSWQLEQLDKAGVDEVVVVSGFKTKMVEDEVAKFHGQMSVRTIYNPFYHVADNLATLWMVRHEMNDGDFIVLNGDTVFTADVAHKLMAEASDPITLTVSVKDNYDDDDMKVIRQDQQLLSVSKQLDLSDVNAESIGFMMFKDKGAKAFQAKIEEVMMDSEGLNVFYLSVIDALASVLTIGTVEVDQDQWQEVDYPVDYKLAVEACNKWLGEGKKQAIAS